MESERPELTEKVKVLIFFAPVAFLRHVEPRIQKSSFFLAQYLDVSHLCNFRFIIIAIVYCVARNETISN